jgi:hypothetical protein
VLKTRLPLENFEKTGPGQTKVDKYERGQYGGIISDGNEKWQTSPLFLVLFSGVAVHDLRCMQLADSTCKVIQKITDYFLQKLIRLSTWFWKLMEVNG